ncbi:MAG: redoxin domain-containing protein [Candidatus Edwardsbacteria bacterium]|nr:redoxin domain-containing protein [Candidatus Edwardsbacteria bacterium]
MVKTAAKIVEVGRKVRAFTLKDQHGQDFRLSACQGSLVLLSFHPLAWTSICATQMKNLEKAHKTLEKLQTIPVGISVDSVPCKEAWGRELKLNQLRILSDFWPHGGLAKKLGIFRPKEGFSERANVLLDAEGRVRLVKVYPLREVPDLEEIIGFIKAR